MFHSKRRHRQCPGCAVGGTIGRIIRLDRTLLNPVFALGVTAFGIWRHFHILHQEKHRAWILIDIVEPVVKRMSVFTVNVIHIFIDKNSVPQFVAVVSDIAGIRIAFCVHTLIRQCLPVGSGNHEIMQIPWLVCLRCLVLGKNFLTCGRLYAYPVVIFIFFRRSCTGMGTVRLSPSLYGLYLRSVWRFHHIAQSRPFRIGQPDIEHSVVSVEHHTLGSSVHHSPLYTGIRLRTCLIMSFEHYLIESQHSHVVYILMVTSHIKIPRIIVHIAEMYGIDRCAAASDLCGSVHDRILHIASDLDHSGEIVDIDTGLQIGNPGIGTKSLVYAGIAVMVIVVNIVRRLSAFVLGLSLMVAVALKVVAVCGRASVLVGIKREMIRVVIHLVAVGISPAKLYLCSLIGIAVVGVVTVAQMGYYNITCIHRLSVTRLLFLKETGTGIVQQTPSYRTYCNA